MRPCRNCGTTERYEKSGACKCCTRKSNAASKLKHKEKVKAYNAAYRKANPEKGRANANRHRERNPERCRERARRLYAMNPEKALQASNAWKRANPQKNKEITEQWREKNRERTRQYAADWKRANPDIARTHNLNRRARKKSAGGNLSAGLDERLFKLQRGKCACGCKQPLGDDYHRDHIMPFALGGSNTDDNIQLLRARCNLQKNKKHPIDFMQERGFLL